VSIIGAAECAETACPATEIRTSGGLAALQVLRELRDPESRCESCETLPIDHLVIIHLGALAGDGVPAEFIVCLDCAAYALNQCGGSVRSLVAA
jgi:hypothetical protein